MIPALTDSTPAAAIANPLARALADWAVAITLRAWRSGLLVCVGCGREWTAEHWADWGRCPACGCRHKSERSA